MELELLGWKCSARKVLFTWRSPNEVTSSLWLVHGSLGTSLTPSSYVFSCIQFTFLHCKALVTMCCVKHLGSVAIKLTVSETQTLHSIIESALMVSPTL
jgi:hypothetical protein